MRRWSALFLTAGLAAAWAVPPPTEDKLTPEQRTEIIRGLMAEYATVKIAIPQSTKPLPLDPLGRFDKQGWDQQMTKNGPAGRVGDLVQITHIGFGGDRLVFEINHGMKGKKKWWKNIEFSGPVSGKVTDVNAGDSNAPGGTVLALVFDKPVPALPAGEFKKMLAPILDFEKHTATELFTAMLPPEFQEAVKAKKVLVGMDRETVLLAKGHPDHKLRETKNGLETEDWIYGKAPGTFTFVTFQGDKVIQIKEAYADAE